MRQLDSLGWRVLVVWECELTRKTFETIHRVADFLSHGKACFDNSMKQHELLAVAEKKVRYRISSYDEEPEVSEE